MTRRNDAAQADQLDALQPDGNFRDDPPTAEEIEAEERAGRLVVERQANRTGPSHPAHDFHDQWRADHGLPPRSDTALDQ